MRLADGGSGGVVACLGVGGLVDLENVLGLEVDEEGHGGVDGVDIWVFDARRPWNLGNVFGAPPQEAVEGQNARKEPGLAQGQISRSYRPGKGGIVVFDDGDIEAELASEREAWHELEEMPEVDDDEEDLGSSSDEDEAEDAQPDKQDSARRKRKSWSDREEDDGNESEKENRPHQRRRSNSVSLLETLHKFISDVAAVFAYCLLTF